MSTMYSQNNLLWKNRIFGFNTDMSATFGRFACLVTGWANMLNDITNSGDCTPETLNDWVKSQRLYVPPDTGILYWEAITRYGFVEAHGTTADVNAINQWLADPANYALVEFNHGAHFSLAPKVGLIVDSIDAKVKPLTTYKVTNAHLFRALPGRGSGTITTSTTVVGEDDMAMTAEQENMAYQDVLGRLPGPGDPAIPTGRTALQFVEAAKPELDAQRANAAAQVAAAMTRAADLQAKLDAVTKQLLASRPDEVDFTTTYQPAPKVRHAAADGLQLDFAGEGADVPFVASTVFTQAGTFVVDGVVLVRTQKSVEAGTWYGTLEDYFDDEPTDRTVTVSPIHAGASMASGLWQRLRQDLLSLFKRKK